MKNEQYEDIIRDYLIGNLNEVERKEVEVQILQNEALAAVYRFEKAVFQAFQQKKQEDLALKQHIQQIPDTIKSPYRALIGWAASLLILFSATCIVWNVRHNPNPPAVDTLTTDTSQKKNTISVPTPSPNTDSNTHVNTQNPTKKTVPTEKPLDFAKLLNEQRKLSVESLLNNQSLCIETLKKDSVYRICVLGNAANKESLSSQLKRKLNTERETLNYIQSLTISESINQVQYKTLKQQLNEIQMAASQRQKEYSEQLQILQKKWQDAGCEELFSQ